MKPLPVTAELEEVSRHVIWFEEPTQVLAYPERFVAYTMTYGTHDDIKTLRRYLSDEDLQEALSKAPPGIFDRRSWAYWHLKLGHYPPPQLPTRQLR